MSPWLGLIWDGRGSLCTHAYLPLPFPGEDGAAAQGAELGSSCSARVLQVPPIAGTTTGSGSSEANETCPRTAAALPVMLTSCP